MFAERSVSTTVSYVYGPRLPYSQKACLVAAFASVVYAIVGLHPKLHGDRAAYLHAIGRHRRVLPTTVGQLLGFNFLQGNWFRMAYYYLLLCGCAGRATNSQPGCTPFVGKHASGGT